MSSPQSQDRGNNCIILIVESFWPFLSLTLPKKLSVSSGQHWLNTFVHATKLSLSQQNAYDSLRGVKIILLQQHYRFIDIILLSQQSPFCYAEILHRISDYW